MNVDDLANPRSYGEPEKLYQLYQYLRDEQPIAYAQPDGYRPFWVMSRAADIRYVETHPEEYLAAPRTVLLPEKVETLYEKKYGDKNGVKPLTHIDGCHHKDLRNVSKDWFSLNSLKDYRPRLQEVAKEFVDHMQSLGGEGDFAQDVAYLYPLRVVLSLMGVPREDERYVLGLTQRLLSPAEKDLNEGGCPLHTLSRYAKASASRGVADVFEEFGYYFDQLGAVREKNPRDDLISVIVNARINGEPMEWREKISYYVIAATAGHDSTAASISGGMNALINNPVEFAKLKSDASLIGSAAIEMVRWTAPVKHFIRTAVNDVEWHGKTIKAGENIMLCFASACRDERVIEDPDTFKVDRAVPIPNLGFGIGVHFCLGRHLAAMEIEAFYSELLPRLKHIELAGTPGYVKSSFVSGHKTLAVKFSFK